MGLLPQAESYGIFSISSPSKVGRLPVLPQQEPPFPPSGDTHILLVSSLRITHKDNNRTGSQFHQHIHHVDG